MTHEPRRWKDSADADELTRGLLSAGRPSASLPPSARVRGERRIDRLAMAPIVVGIGLWSKAVPAAFGAGFAGALALVSVSPSLRQKLEGPAATSPREAACVPAVKARPAANVAPITPPAADSANVERATPPEEPAPAPSTSGVHPSEPVPPIPVRPAPKSAPPSEPEPAPLAPLPETPPHLAGLDAPLPEGTARMPQEESPPPGLSAEVDLLARARALVASDPNGALDLLNWHARAFQNGRLAMEREVLVIEALARSGRVQDAKVRARELLAASPGALYTARLTRILDTGSPP